MPTDRSSIQQLLPIRQDGEEFMVNARDLHAFLGVGKDFSTWIKDRIAKFGFIEGQDYVCVECFDSPFSGNQSGRGGDRRSKDYHLTLDMAKELAMIERTPQGKAARQYFIACEKELRRLEREQRQLPKPSPFAKHLNGVPREEILQDLQFIITLNKLSPGIDENQAYLGAIGQMEAKGIDLKPLLDPKALALESPHRCAELRPTDIARRYNIIRRNGKEDPAAVNRLLADMGYQTRTAKETLSWTPTEKGWPFAVVKDVPRATVQGGRPVRQLFWKDSLLECIDRQLSILGKSRVQESQAEFSLTLQ